MLLTHMISIRSGHCPNKTLPWREDTADPGKKIRGRRLGSHAPDVSMDVVGRTRNLYGVAHVGDYASHTYDFNKVWLVSKQNVTMAAGGGGNTADPGKNIRGRRLGSHAPDVSMDVVGSH